MDPQAGNKRAWKEQDRDGFVVVPFSVSNGPELWINPIIRWQGMEPDAKALRIAQEWLDPAPLNNPVNYSNIETTLGDHDDSQNSLDFCQTVRELSALLQKPNHPESSGLGDDAHRNPSLQKVVWSRTKQIKLKSKAHPCTLFEALCLAYPTLHIVLFQHPAYGVWIGCSPETLVEKNSDRIKSMALAGTRAPGTKEWGPKEIREQKMVLDYLQNRLASNAILLDSQQTSTIQTGPVEHLINQIEGKSTLSSFEIAHLLHPTPAVAGFPVPDSIEFILANEPHQRLLYSGYWGYINPQGDGMLSVNLRCLHWKQNVVTLFMGAGILAESNAEDEWLETCRKSETLMNILEKMDWITAPEEIHP